MNEKYRSVGEQLMCCMEDLGEIEGEGREAVYVVVTMGLIKRGDADNAYSVRQYANCDHWTARGLIEESPCK